MSAATSRLDARDDGSRVATWRSAASASRATAIDRRADRPRQAEARQQARPRLAATIPISFGKAAWVRPRTFCVTESIA